MTELEILARNLKNYKIAYSLTEGELASKLGCSQTWVNQLLKGSMHPSFTMLEKISDLLGLCFADMFTLEPDQFGVLSDEETDIQKVNEANKDFLIEDLKLQIEQLKERNKTGKVYAIQKHGFLYIQKGDCELKVSGPRVRSITDDGIIVNLNLMVESISKEEETE